MDPRGKKSIKPQGMPKCASSGSLCSTSPASTNASNTKGSQNKPLLSESDLETKIVTSTISSGNTTRTIISWKKGRLTNDAPAARDALTARSSHISMSACSKEPVQTDNRKKRDVAIHNNGTFKAARVSGGIEASAAQLPATNTSAAAATAVFPTIPISNPSQPAKKTNIPIEKPRIDSKVSPTTVASKNTIPKESRVIIATVGRAQAQAQDAFHTVKKQRASAFTRSSQYPTDSVGKYTKKRSATDISIDQGASAIAEHSGRSSDGDHIPETDRPSDHKQSKAAHPNSPIHPREPRINLTEAAELGSTGLGTCWCLPPTSAILTMTFPALSASIAKFNDGSGSASIKRPKLDALGVISSTSCTSSIATSTAQKFLANSNMVLYDGVSSSTAVSRLPPVDRETSLRDRPHPALTAPSWMPVVVGRAESRHDRADQAVATQQVSSDLWQTIQPEKESISSHQVPLAIIATHECSTSSASIARDLKDYIPHLKDITMCGNCGRTPAKYLVCLRCLETRYCGKYCQLWDWQLHGQVCSRSVLAKDEEVDRQEEWLGEYWAGAVEMLEVTNREAIAGMDHTDESSSLDDSEGSSGAAKMEEVDDKTDGTPPSMFWSRAMSLHLARGGKLEFGLFENLR